MTNPQPLTRLIGTAERRLQALLQSRLAGAGLSFPEWAALTHLAAAPMPGAALAETLRRGQIDPACIATLTARGLITDSPQGLALSETGRALFAPLRADVAALTAGLEVGLAEEDLAATRRVLATLAERAAGALA